MKADPNSSNGSNPNDPRHAKVSVDITLAPLDGLSSPPRSPAGRHVRDLFMEATPTAYAQIGDILYSTDSRAVLSFIGCRTAVEFSPQTVPLAMDILKLRSLTATKEFLTILAQREYGAFMLGRPPALKGPAFKELRATIADLAVSPERYFSAKDWEQHRGEVLALTTYPITILRGCVGQEVDSLLIKAATRGGLDPEINRAALELLLLREESNPKGRVLSPEHANAIVRAMDDLLRDSFNRMQLVNLLDTWLGKEENQPCDALEEARERLFSQWMEYRVARYPVSPGETPKVFDTIRLLRHFSDATSQLALKESEMDLHKGVALFARLCRTGGHPEDLAELSSYLSPQADTTDTLMALRVFGYGISEEVDAKLWPIFNQYINRTWKAAPSDAPREPRNVAEHVAVVQGIVRRFYTERFDSPFLQNVFTSVGSENRAMAALAINTLVQAVQLDKIPSPTFYDRPELLGPLQAAIRMLFRAGRKEGQDSSLKIGQAVAELFVLKGPAAYGFELSDGEGPESEA